MSPLSPGPSAVGPSDRSERAPRPLGIDVETTGDATTLRVSGEIDLATREQLSAALTAALAVVGDAPPDRTAELVLDLRQVSFIDVHGADALARTTDQAAARGIRLRVLSGRAVDYIAGVTPEWIHIGTVDRPPAGPRRYSTGYEHLAPLFIEHHRLPPLHPRRQTLRDALVEGHLPLARNLARRHRNRGEDIADLEQVATVGLINAVDRFDPHRGIDFLAYAIPTIDGEIRRHYRDRTSTIRIPRRVRQLQAAVLHAVDELRQRTGSSPRPSDIAEYLGLDPGDVATALEANERTHVSSLDEPFADDPAGENTRYSGALSVDDPDLAMVVDRESLIPLLEALPERERLILLMRFFGNQTQSQIADRVGVSQMHVSRLLSKTLATLRAGLRSA
jgi:RNA polymerase sigma-B factor